MVERVCWMKNMWNRIIEIIIAIVIWEMFRLTGIQTRYFIEVENENVLVSQVAHLIFIYLIVLIFAYFIKNRKNTVVKHGIVICSVFWIVGMSVLLIVWPGFWSWDDVAILLGAQHYDYTPWQHFMSGLWHTICLQTLPFSSGVLIIQIFIAGIIVGYCVSSVGEVLFANQMKKKVICEIILLLPAISAPVMMYLLTGFRMGIYSYLELLLIVKVFCLMRHEQKISIQDAIYITLLTIVVSAWRTEAIYYPITMLLCFLVMGKKKVRFYLAGICMLIALVATIKIGDWNNEQIGNNNYSLSATILPVGELVKVADREKDAQALQAINKVLDCNYIYENDGLGGEAYLWNALRYDYSSDDLKEYYKAYIKLALKYPWPVIRETCQMFLESTGIFVTDSGHTTIRTAVTNTEGSTLWLMRGANFERWNSNCSAWNISFNTELRDTVIRRIAFIDDEEKIVPGFRIVWNLMIPITVSFLCFLYCLIKKKWDYVTLFICVFLRVPIILLTACAPYFMYYLSVYLVGYVLSFMVLMEAYDRRKQNM